MVSSGESTGVCLVNLVSNWLTSNSLVWNIEKKQTDLTSNSLVWNIEKKQTD